jgi:serine/threonine protein kinase/tetratricopeptide (TPR) repeat protein
MNEQDDRTQTHIGLPAGKIIGHYRIVEKIGAGGMGEVYLAEDLNLHRRVALKFLPAGLSADGELRARFIREARAAASLNHPNIIHIYEVDEFKGRPYFAMEHVEGHSLHHYCHKEPLGINQIVEIAVQLAQGLGEAHRAGIVHRDIKATNIIVDKSGRARILDFGLATVRGGEELTRTGSTLGTVSYMSPEQVAGKDVDRRSDLFSLGIVLYELIASHTPFRRDNQGATLKAILSDSPEPLARFKNDIPDWLQHIVSKLLEKDRELRYQSAEDLVADLKKLLYDSQQTAGASSPVSRRKSRVGVYVGLAAAAVIVIAAAVWKFAAAPATEAENTQPVLAVLPFENMGQADDDYFADGITDEITSRLGSIPGLKVISRSSAMRYKGTTKSTREIGRELGASYILEGTIRWDKSGDVDQVRITPQLVKVSDDYQMWSNNYQRDLKQIFEVQANIADQIVDALGLTLLASDSVRTAKPPTENMTAYDFYLKGIEHAHRGLDQNDLLSAIAMFDSALAYDSNFALAWAQKSMVETVYAFGYDVESDRSRADVARKAMERSLQLDPALPAAHLARGTYFNFIKRDYETALAEFMKAKSELVNDPDLSESVGIVKLRQGKWEEAIENFEDAIKGDPLTVERYFWGATVYTMVRNYEKADEFLNRAMALDATASESYLAKVYTCLLRAGDLECARRIFEQGVRAIGYGRLLTFELGGTSELSWARYRFVDTTLADAVSMVNALRPDRKPFAIHLTLGQLYDQAGFPDSARIHYDSSRIFLERIVQHGTDDFDIYCGLGLTYALLGMKEKAVETGEKGAEMMTVDDCHW